MFSRFFSFSFFCARFACREAGIPFLFGAAGTLQNKHTARRNFDLSAKVPTRQKIDSRAVSEVDRPIVGVVVRNKNIFVFVIGSRDHLDPFGKRVGNNAYYFFLAANRYDQLFKLFFRLARADIIGSSPAVGIDRYYGHFGVKVFLIGSDRLCPFEVKHLAKMLCRKLARKSELVFFIAASYRLVVAQTVDLFVPNAEYLSKLSSRKSAEITQIVFLDIPRKLRRNKRSAPANILLKLIDRLLRKGIQHGSNHQFIA